MTLASETKLGKKEERKLKMRSLLVHEEADPTGAVYVLRQSQDTAVSGLEEGIIVQPSLANPSDLIITIIVFKGQSEYFFKDCVVLDRACNLA